MIPCLSSLEFSQLSSSVCCPVPSVGDSILLSRGKYPSWKTRMEGKPQPWHRADWGWWSQCHQLCVTLPEALEGCRSLNPWGLGMVPHRTLKSNPSDPKERERRPCLPREKWELWAQGVVWVLELLEKNLFAITDEAQGCSGMFRENLGCLGMFRGVQGFSGMFRDFWGCSGRLMNVQG